MGLELTEKQWQIFNNAEAERDLIRAYNQSHPTTPKDYPSYTFDLTEMQQSKISDLLLPIFMHYEEPYAKLDDYLTRYGLIPGGGRQAEKILKRQDDENADVEFSDRAQAYALRGNWLEEKDLRPDENIAIYLAYHSDIKYLQQLANTLITWCNWRAAIKWAKDACGAPSYRDINKLDPKRRSGYDRNDIRQEVILVLLELYEYYNPFDEKKARFNTFVSTRIISQIRKKIWADTVKVNDAGSTTKLFKYERIRKAIEAVIQEKGSEPYTFEDVQKKWKNLKSENRSSNDSDSENRSERELTYTAYQEYLSHAEYSIASLNDYANNEEREDERGDFLSSENADMVTRSEFYVPPEIKHLIDEGNREVQKRMKKAFESIPKRDRMVEAFYRGVEAESQIMYEQMTRYLQEKGYPESKRLDKSDDKKIQNAALKAMEEYIARYYSESTGIRFERAKRYVASAKSKLSAILHGRFELSDSSIFDDEDDKLSLDRILDDLNDPDNRGRFF